MISAFFYGAFLATGLIVPLGMQNLFIFNQGATQVHYVKALPSVITAFLCDAILILCAVLGISLFVLTAPLLKDIILITGILFLMYMGFLIWKTQSNSKVEKKPLSVKDQIWFGASVSLLNPHAILDTTGIIGTNSLNFSGYDKCAYTLACIGVSFCWFFGLSIAGHLFKKFDKTGFIVFFANKTSAVIMWIIAFYLAWQLTTGHLHS